MPAHPLLKDYDALLVDLDGTVFEGGRPIDGAAEGLAEHAARNRVMYVTNNASRSPEQVAEHLTRLGFPTEPNFVLTSAMAAVDLAVAHVRAEGIDTPTAYVIGAESFRELARTAGLGVVDNADGNPDVVLHGHSPDNGWATLSEGALAIRRGATYIASNLDTTLPSERGLLVGNGSMVAAVVSATGVAPQSAGKPEPAMFVNAQERLGSVRPLAVGDRLDTDIAGGNAAGIDTLCTLTGISGHWDVLKAPVSQRPTHIVGSLRDHLDGWSAEQESLVDGTHRIVIASGEVPDESVSGGDALDDRAVALMAAEAVAVAAPYVWSLLDSGVPWEAITCVPATTNGVDPDAFAEAAVSVWR
ncbi:HAD-IIA family hydrolase [Corynebacterium sp. zg254]|uniref:HAD-IIA family hydrolase n=1 Tax=Corynebacterium zhongnanshanii TaxID=2768834 RepID=A0ABQ6VGN9_9CORY|nr:MULTISPECIES: HAD-IIA family hydrolase [Corynebacterium]KAB3523575.1 HAD-IIA family hydrolase [Corynebacterium zhongnanshanii]MCR5913262.1 HAD-IIA family hydrolase [Corynebacterium sp. zg254]